MVPAQIAQKKSGAVWILAFAVFLFAACRLLTLFTAVENISWPEELGVGTIAREMIVGMKRPFWDYQIDVYAGESLISALMAVPFFKLLGANLIALKMVTFVCSVLTVTAAVFFLNRHFGLRAALWAVFFIAFSPPAFVAHSLIPMNGHTESLLYSILMLIAFYEFLSSARPKKIWIGLFGILGGFGFWFCYATGIAFVTCIAVWACLSPRTLFSKKGILAFAFFFLGLFPWFLSNSAHSFDGARFLSAAFHSLPEGGPRVLERFLSQGVFSFPKAFTFLSQDSLWRTELTYGYFFLFLAILFPFWLKKVIHRKTQDSQKWFFFLLYPIFFGCAYASSNFVIPDVYPLGTVAFRYYTPLYFFCSLWLGGILGEGKASKILLVPLLAFSLAAQQGLFFREPPGRGLHYQGYTYLEHGVRWELPVSPENPVPELVKTASLFTTPENQYLFWGMVIGWEARREASHPRGPLLSASTLEIVPPSWRHFLVETVAAFMSREEKKLQDLLPLAKDLPAPLKEYFYRGILMDSEGAVVRELSEDPLLLEKIDPLYRRWAYWSLGHSYEHGFFETGIYDSGIQRMVPGFDEEGRKWFYRGRGNAVFGTDLATFFLEEEMDDFIKKGRERVPEAYRPDFYWGAGWAIRKFFPEDKIRAKDWLLRVSGPYQDRAAEGFDACEKSYGL